ncbi:hypothetical protein, partial [Sphingobium sp.]|uniref:hypothetical protein n=1 Tax=Sphingobium sp. TaxID=1912891 RepID=UPI0028BD7F97
MLIEFLAGKSWSVGPPLANVHIGDISILPYGRLKMVGDLTRYQHAKTWRGYVGHADIDAFGAFGGGEHPY